MCVCLFNLVLRVKLTDFRKLAGKFHCNYNFLLFTLIVLLVKSLVMLTNWQMLTCSDIDGFEVLIH